VLGNFAVAPAVAPQHFKLTGGSNDESTSLNKAASHVIVKSSFHGPTPIDHLKPLSSLVRLVFICEYYMWIWKYSEATAAAIYSRVVSYLFQSDFVLSHLLSCSYVVI